MGWVSRRQYDDACQQIRTLERNVTDARTAADNALRQLELVTKLLERVIDRWERSTPIPGKSATSATPLQPLARVERSDLDIAIELQSMNDPGLARHLHRYAQEARLIGTNETDLINAILHWQSSDDEAGVT